MNCVTFEEIGAELNLAPFEIQRLVEAGVIEAECSGKFDVAWCRLALRAWRLREPQIISMMTREAADKVAAFWCRSEILDRTQSAGPQARADLTEMGRDALRHLHLLVALTTGRDQERHRQHVAEIEAALDRLAGQEAA